MAALAIPLLTSGISALAGLFGGKGKTTEQKQTTTSSGSSSTTPNLTAQQQDLINQILSGYQSRLKTGADLTGYTGQGLQNINRTSNIAKKMSDNILASRGLSASPYASFVDNQADQARAGESSSFLNTIPTLQRQMQGEDLSGLLNVFSAIPKATSSTQNGTQTTVGNIQQPGNMTAGALSGAGAALASPYDDQTSNAQQIASKLGAIFGKKPAFTFGSTMPTA